MQQYSRRLTSSSVIGLCIIVMVDSSASQEAQNFSILSASSKKVTSLGMAHRTSERMGVDFVKSKPF
jgi:hypothetical protein